jgi:hypothetical protein
MPVPRSAVTGIFVYICLRMIHIYFSHLAGTTLEKQPEILTGQAAIFIQQTGFGVFGSDHAGQ